MMLSKLRHTLFILIIFSTAIFAQKKITTFQHTFRGAGMNGGLFVSNTLDSGFIVTGQHETSGAGSCDIYIYKHDKCGLIDFYKTYGGSGVDGGTSIAPTTDGGYICSAFGSSWPSVGTGYQSVLLKTDGNGVTQWFKAYGNPTNENRYYHVEQNTDGGYIVCGWAVTYYGVHAYVTRTDASGNILWSNEYGNGNYVEFKANYVEQTSDGGFIVMGNTNMTSATIYSLFLMKLDAAGNIQWFKRYNNSGPKNYEPGEEDEMSVSGQVTVDGGYISVINATQGFLGKDDILLLKTDFSGNVQWAKAYGDTARDLPRCVRQTKDNGYIISGFTQSFGAGDEDSYLIRTDVNGNLQWSRAYGGPGREKAEGVREFYDGGFVVDGHTNSFGANVFDVYSLKTDSDGVTSCHEVIAQTKVVPVSITPTILNVGAFQSTTTIAPKPFGVMTDEPVVEQDFTPDEVVLCEQDLSIKPHFTPSKVCIGKAITFQDNSTVSNGVLNSWLWDFGDGSPLDSTPNPTHTYATADTFLVKLVVNGTESCFPSSLIDTVIVYPDPIAVFTSTPVCLNNATPFTNTSSGNGGTIASYNWNFGEPSSGINNTSTLQTPSHTFSAADTFDVNLIIVTNAGCSDTITQKAVVNPLPQAAFTSIDVCKGLPTFFTDQSTIATGDTIKTWGWNFDDPGSGANNIAATPNATHTYNTDGSYNILLTVTSGKGCQSNTSKTVNVNPIPLAAFTPANVCVGNPVNVVDNSSVSTGSVNNWHWDFGVTPDVNDTSNIKNPAYTYTVAGTYTVTLIAISDKGCKDTTTAPVIIYPNAVPKFSATEVCLNSPNVFSDSSKVATGTIDTYHWDYGVSALTNDTANTQNASYTYSSAGTYTASLTVSANGCKATYQLPVVVNPLPVADFTSIDVCQNVLTTFTDKSTVAPGTITSWNWDLGETGVTSTLQTPTHTYAANGTYTVTLAIQTNKSCVDTIIHPVTVHPLPVVNFGPPAKGCMPVCLTIYDSSTVALPDNIATWSWNLGDNTTSTDKNPYHCYNSPGVYNVSLTVHTNHNCTGSKNRDSLVQVYPFPSANFNADPSSTSIFQTTITFTDQSVGNPVAWAWDFGDPADSHDTLQNTHFTYPEIAGTYNIHLTVTNMYGCVADTVKPIEIIPEWTFYAPNTFTPNGDGTNDVFFGTGIGHVEKEMWIFDRWGNEIYHVVGLNGVWDGKVQGGTSNEIAQIDTYVWLIRIKEVFGNYHSYIGHVNIVK